MPATTFLLRALLVDPLSNPLPDVPVRPFAYDLTKDQWAPVGEVGYTDAQGLVEIEITGSPPVTSPFLGTIALRHEETDVVLAEQWWSYTSGNPRILDYGEVRVWVPPLTALSERSLAGVPAPIADALGDAGTVADLQAQLAATQGELANAQAQLTASQNSLASTQAQLTASQNSLASTQAQLTASQNSLASTQAQLTSTQNTLASTQSTLVATQVQLSATQDTLVATQGELSVSQAQLSDLQGAHAATLGQLADLQGALGQLQSTHDATLAELALANAELAELHAASGATASLESVVDAVGEQLHATQSRLVSNGSPFQLGRLSLSLKVVPTSATSFGFATMAQLETLGSDALSTLDLDFSQTAPVPTEPTPDAAVPSLVGLTEPAARRRLVPLGLGASVVHQAIADDGDVALAGRVIKQVPAAGAEIQPGQVVTLVLGKALVGAAT